MNWKKNVFSYMLWLVCAGAVCAGLLALGTHYCRFMGYPAAYGSAVGAGLLALVGAVVYVLRRVVRGTVNRWGTRNNCPDSSSRGSSSWRSMQVWESLCLVLLLAVGLYLRVKQLGNLAKLPEGMPTGMAYFEAAKVAAGQAIPRVVHGATYVYLHLLHGLLILLGNKVLAALGMQLLLHLSGAVMLYLAVRRWSGALTGLVTIAFFMLSPTAIRESAHLSPGMFWFCLYALALYCLTLCWNKYVGTFFIGMLIGLVTYLDILGLTLVLFLLAAATVRREQEAAGDFRWDRDGDSRRDRIGAFWGNRLGVVVCALLGAAFSFLGCIGLDALTSGAVFQNVLLAWTELYRPGDFSFSILNEMTSGSGALTESLVLLGLLTVGVFGFWCQRKLERQGVWIAAAAAVLAMQGFGMLGQNEGAELFPLIFLAVLAGAGVESVFAVESFGKLPESAPAEVLEEQADGEASKPELPEPEEEGVAFERVTEPEEGADFGRAAEPEEEGLAFAKVAKPREEAEASERPTGSGVRPRAQGEDRSAPRPAVQYIENPLPLPKKHQPRILDYHITELAAEDDYDHAVAADDDFDVK